ncbi:Phosphoribosyl-dephospho-CoA transferase [Usitatibacter rugosus]|uniref:Phosphoribosyl-dephospho-CoA transferase n=1 Tax=Usitatibacter rugosus TaxID=2732067 RepID=A0A6M4H260_9PROT|nr:Phosphoribosyl-dephospho-CoA transferase [Usitatibacter rugosus]
MIARARQPDDDPARHAIGLALPPTQGKLRIALTVAADGIARIEEPPALREAAAVLPYAMRTVATGLAELADHLGFTARVFGSLAWQHRTGEAYLSQGSDLDLLAAPPSTSAVSAWLSHLASLEARSPMRLDGEIEFRDGGAVNWRELAGGASSLLVKAPDGARLVPASAWAAAWA